MTDDQHQYTDEYLKNVKRCSKCKSEVFQDGHEEKCVNCEVMRLEPKNIEPNIVIPFTDL